MHEHLLVYNSPRPAAASRYTFSAFTSMKDKRLRGSLFGFLVGGVPLRPQPRGHALAALAALCLGPAVRATDLWF